MPPGRSEATTRFLLQLELVEDALDAGPIVAQATVEPCPCVPVVADVVSNVYVPGPASTIGVAQLSLAGTGAPTIAVIATATNARVDSRKRRGSNGIAAPSANRYGAVSPTTADAVSAELKDYLESKDQILDGGPSLVGLESTIIDCTQNNPSILRPGAITAEMIEETTGIIVVEPEDIKIRVSGSHKQHYAPQAHVIIGTNTQSGEGLIAMSDIETPHGAIRLAAPQSIEEYARNLYSALREGDKQGLQTIHIAPPTGEGLALAIRDRIKRAASRP